MIDSLFLVRHGETDWNRQGLIQGKTDVPLSDAGRQQVRTLAPMLAGCGASAIWTSPQLRARETATILATYLHLPVEEVAELVEIDCGAWEGRTVADIAAADRECYDAWLTSASAAAPGGESFEDVARRAASVVERMRALPAGSGLFLVSHAATIRLVAAALLDLPLLAVVRFSVDPGSVSVVKRWAERDTFRLERWNARML